MLIIIVVAFVWFLLLIGTGMYNITTYPGIFRALDPSRAVLCESLSSMSSLHIPNTQTSVRAHTRL